MFLRNDKKLGVRRNETASLKQKTTGIKNWFKYTATSLMVAGLCLACNNRYDQHKHSKASQPDSISIVEPKPLYDAESPKPIQKSQLELLLEKNEKSNQQTQEKPKVETSETKQAELDTKLLKVANFGEILEVRKLLNKGADVNAKNDRGQTPLMMAIWGSAEPGNIGSVKSHIGKRIWGTWALGLCLTDEGLPACREDRKRVLKTITLLLNKGANVNAMDEYGETPLMKAVWNNYDIRIMKLLLNRGAKVNVKDQWGETPLMKAVVNYDSVIGDNGVARLLLNRGAKVNTQDDSGSTALIWAVDDGETKMVKLLLKRKAKVNISNIDGDTPLIIATRHDYVEIAKLLKSYGAKE